MKKILCLFCLFILLICNTGCVTFHEKFERVSNIENISYMEIYFIESSYDPFNEDIQTTLEPIKILNNNMYKQVIEDLESLDYKVIIPLFAPSDPSFNLYGFVIKIMYNSGIYQLVSNAGAVYTYDSNGYLSSFHARVEQDIWDNLIIKYLGKEVFDQYKLPF